MIAPRIAFADASFYIALMSMKDSARPRAIAWRERLLAQGTRLVTTEAVLWEWLNFFADASTRAHCLEGYRRLHRDPGTEIVQFDRPSCALAVELYASRPDKGWGITDCLSFVVMRERGITDALTTDHHFEQAGFESLMLMDPPAA